MADFTVKTSCHTCGDVILPVESITVFIYPRKVELNYYRFSCPTCTAVVSKTAAAGHLVQMIQGGSLRQVIDIPVEVFEDKPLLPSLTQDDILDFMLEIEREDHLAPLAE